MNATETKTIRAKVAFTLRTAGRYANHVTTVGRNGKIRPVLEQNPTAPASNKKAWTVTLTSRTDHTEAQDEIPAYDTITTTVFVHVPWRLSREPLTADEIEKINQLAVEAVGGNVVIVD